MSHLVCGGVYDWSTGLLYQGGRYFDPMLGIWLALLPLAVVQGWKKKRKSGHPWVVLVCVGLFAVGSLAGCGNTPSPIPMPDPALICTSTLESAQGSGECDTNCKGIAAEMEFVSFKSSETQHFLVSRNDGDLQFWDSEKNDTEATYGTTAAFRIVDAEGTAIDFPSANENCMVVQLAKGHRKLTNPDEIHYEDKNYGVDGDEKTGKYNLLYENYTPYRGGWVFIDSPASTVEAGQTIDWDENYVTFLCEKCFQSTFESLYHVGSALEPAHFESTYGEYIVTQKSWYLQNKTTYIPGG